jgi:hypothetical protein
MDKEKTVNNFLRHVDRLVRLPLITNAEMDCLYGEEMAAAVAKLDSFNRQEKTCERCQSRCCPACGCELYAPQFSRCPIYDFRPVVCRLHFCHQFNGAQSSLIRELTDIFFDSLATLERQGNAKVRLFDCPPLTRTAPDLVAVVSPWVNTVREGSLNPEYATKLIHQQAQEYCHRTMVGVNEP